MKTVLGALFSVAVLTAACAPAVADLSPNPSASAIPSASASLSGEVPPEEMPPVILTADHADGGSWMFDVGQRLVFDLPTPSSWTIASDTAASGILELRTGATLEATAIKPGGVTVTFTNGTDTVEWSIIILVQP